MYKAIDLYSGIGGWTLGMKLSGVENIASYEWWREANQTHNINFNTNHKEVDIRKIDVQRDLNFDQKINFVVGSPPCTQFSLANRGGNGDIQDGLVDIYKFLEVVEYLKPKYWAMENVPRVAKILEKELNGGSLNRFKNLVTVIQVVDSADYGVPQNRKRMIAGNFPIDLFDSYKSSISKVLLGDVIKSLNNEIVSDVNYGYRIAKDKITELEDEAKLTYEEERINKDAKTYHPIYNNMSFPDRLNRPSRTITATCTRVSRESIIIPSEKGGFRRLNVRERGVLQGFPITYQFYGKTLNSKFKMIGNAVPPILTHYIFQSMMEVSIEDVKHPMNSEYFHEQPSYKTYTSNLGLPKRKYPAKRKFQFSVPNLRFGSGVRFELSNSPKSENNEWSFKFFYGNSKNIKSIPLNNDLLEALSPILNTSRNEVFTEKSKLLESKYNQISSKELQILWTSANNNRKVFDFLDDVGECVSDIMETADLTGFSNDLMQAVVKERNNKLDNHKESVLAGFYFLSGLNKKIFN